MRGRASIALVALVFSFAQPAYAHPLAPAGVDLREEPGGALRMATRIPRQVRPGERPRLELPSDCAPSGNSEVVDEPGYRLVRSEYRCAAPLEGRAVHLSGVVPRGTALILRYESTSGSGEWMMDWRSPSVLLELTTGGFASSVRLGLEHLLTGLDHLLLVLGLTYLFGFRRALLVALGAFTLGHAGSLAFVLVAGLWPPPGVVEGAILLTLLMVGLEIGSPEAGWTRRHPAAVPLTVGLIHGCGFAGALRETGLPEGALASILIPFHIGLEMAQLGLVALVAFPLLLLSRLPERRGDADRLVAALVGGAAIAMLLAGHISA